jgi:cytochrome c biogenesis protein ResB
MKKILNTNSQNTSVSVLMINMQGIMLTVLDQDYFISYARIPWLKNARISDVLNVKMCGHSAIEWEALGVDLEIESLKHPERYSLIMKCNSLDNIE